MNDRPYDQDQGAARVVETWLREGVEALPDGDALPGQVMDRIMFDVEQLPQRTGWRRWPGWRGRARLKLSRAGLTAGVAVLLASAALLTPLATDMIEDLTSVGSGTTYDVALDGSGEFATIAEAVAVAHDGDTVRVAPGTYTEALVVERDITLQGMGWRDVIIIAPEDGPAAQVTLYGRINEKSPYAILLKDTTATIENLMLVGERSLLHASGGSPTLRNLGFAGVGIGFAKEGNQPSIAVVIYGGSRTHVVGSEFSGGSGSEHDFPRGGVIAIWDRSEPLIVGNRFRSSGIVGRLGDGTVVRENTFRGSEVLLWEGPTTATFEANQFVESRFAVGTEQGPGIDPLVRGNDFSGSLQAIGISSLAEPRIEDNRFIGNELAIVIRGSDPTISGNQFRHNASGIFVMQGAPLIEGNTITGGTVGVGLGSEDAAPTLTGNTTCDNATNVNITFGAQMPDTAGNTICADAQDMASQ